MGTNYTVVSNKDITSPVIVSVKPANLLGSKTKTFHIN